MEMIRQFLWDIIPLGYGILQTIESWRGPIGDFIFPIVSDIGGHKGSMAIIAIIYWSVDKTLGKNIAKIMLYSSVLNIWIKNIWSIPRPDNPQIVAFLKGKQIVGDLNPLRQLSSPSFLSGHTQGAVVTWGYLCQKYRNIYFYIFAIFMIALIAYSRMYLGVHFPQDIIGGFVVGTILLLIWVFGEKIALEGINKTIWQLFTIIFLPLILIIFSYHKEVSISMGGLMGLGIAFFLEEKFINFSTKCSSFKRVFRVVLGGVMLILTSLLTKKVFGSDGAYFQAFRYIIIGFTGGFLIPWLFYMIDKIGNRVVK